jgi:hypothetical protein
MAAPKPTNLYTAFPVNLYFYFYLGTLQKNIGCFLFVITPLRVYHWLHQIYIKLYDKGLI